MAGVDDHKEDDAYSLQTPQNLVAVLTKENKEDSDMEAFFERFWEKQAEFQKKLEDSQADFHKKQEENQKSFSAEMAALVVGLREVVDTQGKVIKEQRREILGLMERVDELERKRGEGGSTIGDEVVDLVQSMIIRQVEDSKEKTKRECQVRITGLKEDDQENPKRLRNKVVEVFEEKMKVEGAAAMVVDSFRIGKRGDKFGRPRVIIARLGSVGQRNEILRGKRHLGEWRNIGVDVDRTKEEMEAFREELKKKKEVEEKGGKAALVKGKMVMLEAPPEKERGGREQNEEGWVKYTSKKGNQKPTNEAETEEEIAESSLIRTRRSTRSTSTAKGNGGQVA
jgi:hypothetical protein